MRRGKRTAKIRGKYFTKGYAEVERCDSGHLPKRYVADRVKLKHSYEEYHNRAKTFKEAARRYGPGGDLGPAQKLAKKWERKADIYERVAIRAQHEEASKPEKKREAAGVWHELLDDLKEMGVKIFGIVILAFLGACLVYPTITGNAIGISGGRTAGAILIILVA
ncbi:HAD family hydrolase, partial [Candidatus Woesearchaeota archaeon]|nr:HAD family hydrolase [Candidatus Woesearchaeota archaeon]